MWRLVLSPSRSHADDGSQQLCPQHCLPPIHHPAPTPATLLLGPLQRRTLAGGRPPLLLAASQGAAAAAHPRHAPRAGQAVAELQRCVRRAGHGVLFQRLLVAQLLLRWGMAGWPGWPGWVGCWQGHHNCLHAELSVLTRIFPTPGCTLLYPLCMVLQSCGATSPANMAAPWSWGLTCPHM